MLVEEFLGEINIIIVGGGIWVDRMNDFGVVFFDVFGGIFGVFDVVFFWGWYGGWVCERVRKGSDE